MVNSSSACRGCFFFFQAEDGIRDLTVTGVQTCALPICVVEDLKQSGYVEARRGKGVFVAPAPPVRPAPHLREGFLQDTVMRAAALGMTADDLAVAVLSVASVRPAAVQETVEVLLVECSPPELDFFAGQLEAHLPVRVDKVLLGDLMQPAGARLLCRAARSPPPGSRR